MEAHKERHLHYAGQHPFPFGCDPRLFSEEQYALITRWGHWYQALADGLLEPITEAQRVFIAAVRGSSPPTEPHAEAWWRYRMRLVIEARHGDAMHRSHQLEDDTFLSRDMAKQMRRTMGGVNLREHKRG